MNELLIQAADLEQVRHLASESADEISAVLLTREVQTNRKRRLLGWQLQLPGSEDYQRRGRFEVQLSPGYVARVAKLAKRHVCGVTFLHSHPGEGLASFSAVDDAGEAHLSAFLDRRCPQQVHGSLVFNRTSYAARILGTQEPLVVIEIGDNRRRLFDPSSGVVDDATFDRQVRAFGAQGQQAVGSLRIGIVGLGGTGSVVAQELAYLGVRDFVLIDPDVIENTNLNRVVGASRKHLGELKINVAQESIRGITQGRASVETIPGNVVYAKVAAALRDADIVFGCTDSHGSRMALQQIAYQFLVPCIDMGTTIVARDGLVTHISGRVQLLTPGRPCLTCVGLLDSEEVRRDLMSPEERQLDPYIVGAREPAPSVISLNSTVASLAVTMFLAITTRLTIQGRHLIYNALASSLRVIRADAQPSCFICSREDGVVALGDSGPWMLRQDS